MTVENMLSNMTQKEIVYWMAYRKIKLEAYEKNKEESASQTSIRHGANKAVDLKTNRPVTHYKDMPTGNDGFRVVTEEQQKIADNNLLLFMERYAHNSRN